jgi:hypothetical protein
MALAAITRQDLQPFRTLFVKGLNESMNSKTAPGQKMAGSPCGTGLLNISDGGLQDLRINGIRGPTLIGGAVVYYSPLGIEKVPEPLELRASRGPFP